MPANSKILHIGTHGGDLCDQTFCWVIVDTEEKIIKRKIKMFGTGQDIKFFGFARDWEFISTVQYQGGKLVFHFFDTQEET